MRIRRPVGSISKWWILLGVLGGPAAVVGLLVGASTVGPWIVALGALGAVAWAIKHRGGSDGDAAGVIWSSDSSSSEAAAVITDRRAPDRPARFGGSSDTLERRRAHVVSRGGLETTWLAGFTRRALSLTAALVRGAFRHWTPPPDPARSTAQGFLSKMRNMHASPMLTSRSNPLDHSLHVLPPAPPLGGATAFDGLGPW
ncbi:MAG TPA: hypothetical protein VD994_22200 [Prosthecobacter sp.]|nr:hypothetical protein [Prosthecobacter sp.]